MNRVLIFCLAFGIACSQPSPTSQTPKAEVGLDSLEAAPLLPTDTLNVGFLVMEGTYNTELTAPMDIFQHTIFHAQAGMRVFTIAATTDPIHTFEGLEITPDYSYSEAHPVIDILVVPSAEHHLDTDLKNEEMIQFVRETSEEAQYVMSLCDGAFVLAKAGLLDGHVSTTFPGDIGAYRKRFPQLDVREDLLFVHHGKFITSAGGAKSFEPALYLSEYLYGKKAADGIARGMVIDWKVHEVPHLVVE
ncbi:DJ-1/PfpI family protein [Pontibacter sp. G13]|uniref:DJ-1/PfpI family protein n=1 Tax=Pontibacter sp. G13 TaxID=3074898 RepID=UPI00288C304E|nr:DJ-1/PfpI family protein [Pontibacter sp. G13]WNJ18896.1 DJ-1/PfpI family protein [Pontibacter sp. G13]